MPTANYNADLHLAASNGHLKVTALLIEKGANIKAQDRFGQSALHLAADEGHLDVTALLIEKGGNALNLFCRTC